MAVEKDVGLIEAFQSMLIFINTVELPLTNLTVIDPARLGQIMYMIKDIQLLCKKICPREN